jgi:hypothetical protein
MRIVAGGEMEEKLAEEKLAEEPPWNVFGVGPSKLV